MTQTTDTIQQATPEQATEQPAAHEVMRADTIPADHSMMAVPLARIRRNPSIDPRQHRNKARMASMLESFERDGIIQPITIRPVVRQEGDSADFEVVAGNTRFDGAVELGKATIPAIIRHVSAREAVVLAGVENMQRQDLSPIEEGHYAARLLAAEKNDYTEVCNLLDWSESKLKSRIMLTHVDEFVQNALVQGDLKIGHVELLAGVPQRQQKNIATKIIDEAISVAETKERLSKGTRQLAKACFTLDDCQGCRFNSSTIGDMFASAEGASKDYCSNAACWDEKTEKALSIIVTDAQAEYGTVLREKEVPADGYTTLEAHGDNGVGVEQKANCASCEHYGCIISTTFGTEGQIRGEQCFNLECHAEKVTQYRTAMSEASGGGASSAPVSEPTGASSATPAAEDGDAPSKSKPEKKKSAPLTPATLKRGIKKEAMSRFVQMGQDAISGSERVGVAIALLTLHGGFRSDFPATITEKADDVLKRLSTDAEALPPINANVTDNKALLLARLSVDELNAAITVLASLTVWRLDGDRLENHPPHQNAARYAQARNINRDSYLAVTPEYLKAQTKPGIIEDCKRSGFDAAYDAEHGEKAFLSLTKGKASDLLAAITAFTDAGDFDWHGYEPIGFAPDFYFDGV